MQAQEVALESSGELHDSLRGPALLARAVGTLRVLVALNTLGVVVAKLLVTLAIIVAKLLRAVAVVVAKLLGTLGILAAKLLDASGVLLARLLESAAAVGLLPLGLRGRLAGSLAASDGLYKSGELRSAQQLRAQRTEGRKSGAERGEHLALADACAAVVGCGLCRSRLPSRWRHQRLRHSVGAENGLQATLGRGDELFDDRQGAGHGIWQPRDKKPRACQAALLGILLDLNVAASHLGQLLDGLAPVPHNLADLRLVDVHVRRQVAELRLVPCTDAIDQVAAMGDLLDGADHL
mmetsp:Transcript_5857/g.14541  ORF Transcript_5857/g.14541 Transcript_5857/m.14541 type:complete len:294 (-) Transcript_5857:362-1243(-)